MLRLPDAAPPAPSMIVTTPVGQHHELGAMIIAVTAVSEGWQTTYLGPDLPAEEIAGAAELAQPRAVALSIVYPPYDSRLVVELKKLGRYLSDGVVVVAGGRAADGYRETLDAIGAICLRDIPSFRGELRSLRSREPLRQ